jgi:hypothetical protein
VPRFVYREFLGQVGQWLRRAGRHDALALLTEEIKLFEYFGFFVESWLRRKDRAPRRTATHGGDVVAASTD